MYNYFIVLNASLLLLTASISWRGDGEGLAVNTIDKEDNISRVRMYNQQLELISTARNVADGPASVMRGIGQVVSYATNGSYIAVCQQQRGAGNSATTTASATAVSPVRSSATAPQKLQVALVERNGLRHGDFDLQLPGVPVGYDRWQECSLHWDLPTTLIAVGLRAVRDTESFDQLNASEATGRPGLLHVYYRANYHWYLKQQWRGEDLAFLGFDAEQVNRMYLSQTRVTQVEPRTMQRVPLLRVVEFTWDIVSSLSADSTVAVVDGTKLLLTPLGINNIPPPMCKHTISITQHNETVESDLPVHCTRAACYWQPHSSAAPIIDTTNDHQQAWGYAALADNNSSLILLRGDATGAVLSQQQVHLDAVYKNLSADLFTFRGIVATQQDDHLVVTLLGSNMVPLALPDRLGRAFEEPNYEATEHLVVVRLFWDPSSNAFVLSEPTEQ